jgi:hypothetical protein
MSDPLSSFIAGERELGITESPRNHRRLRILASGRERSSVPMVARDQVKNEVIQWLWTSKFHVRARELNRQHFMAEPLR